MAGCPNCGWMEGYEINSMSDFICAHCGALICMNPLAKATMHNRGPSGPKNDGRCGYYVKMLDARVRYPEFADYDVTYWRIDRVLAMGNSTIHTGLPERGDK